MWKISKLSEEEKDIKRKKVRDRYKSISEKKNMWVYEKTLFDT